MSEVLIGGSSPPVPTIVIVGAGFSGALTAVNLLRLAPAHGVRVVLINKSGRMARGVAYGTASSDHVLNVPAGNMSALVDDPDDFLRYCRWSDPDVEPSSFVSRRLYGTYLEALLASAEHGCGQRSMLQRMVGEVESVVVDPASSTAHVVTADGVAIEADHVVLAFGNFPPADPPAAPPELVSGDRYVRDPWAPGALAAPAYDDELPVLLLGSGLTAIDVALSVHAADPRRRIMCVSRRGLSPTAHRASRGVPPGGAVETLLADMGTTARGYVAAVRRHVSDEAVLGRDWRDVLASLRPHTPGLWHRLPEPERRRFLRHVQPYWDVLRHRSAPGPFERYCRLVDSGQVTVTAGRVLAFESDADGVTVTLRRRADGETQRLRVAYVVNCTGPDADLRRRPSALVGQLLDDGSICVDRLGLGLEVDDAYGLIDHGGDASPVLHYVGPLLKARDWEATAVPELRVHARRLAERLLG